MRAFTKAGKLEQEADRLSDERRYGEAAEKYHEASEAYGKSAGRWLYVSIGFLVVAIISEVIGIVT